MSDLQISNFYQFCDLPQSILIDRQRALQSSGDELSLLGLIILASEGINGSVAGHPDQVRAFESQLSQILGPQVWDFKRAECRTPPFRTFRVKIRPEIVTSGDPELQVDSGAIKLSPEAWHAALSEFNSDEALLLDTRNIYETKIGKFRGAVDPGIANFQELEGYVRDANIPTSKKVYMYCTGGIRCEKAAVQMKRLGYDQIFQLEGGILRYLERYPHEHFVGDCFVFDGRVAVDQSLAPTADWAFCPHCGDPAKDLLQCRFCGANSKVCETCRLEAGKNTCSKNCEYQLEHHPSQKMNS